MPGAVRSRALDLGHRARSAAARLRQAATDWMLMLMKWKKIG